MRALLLAAALSVTASAREVPRLRGHVNDHAGLMSSDARAGLEVHLRDFEQATGRQIAILTVDSLEGAPLESYSLEVARTWKLGRSGVNDGVLFLISKNDRKLRIEVGHGLEGVLTDALAGRIIQNEVAPRFRAGGFEEGVQAGAAAIMGTIDGTYVPPKPPARPPEEQFSMFLFYFILAVLITCGSTLVGRYSWTYVFFVGGVALSCPGEPWGPYSRWYVCAAAMGIYSVLRYFDIGLEHYLNGLGSGGGGFYGGSSGGGSSDGGSDFSGGGGSFGGGGASGSW